MVMNGYSHLSQNGKHSPPVFTFWWFIYAVLLLPLMLVVIERKWRAHYIESKSHQRAATQQRALVALLCHGIRNPLNVVSFFLTELSATLASAQVQVQALSSAAPAAHSNGSSGSTSSSMVLSRAH